jgi:hypothetical protein
VLVYILCSLQGSKGNGPGLANGLVNGRALSLGLFLGIRDRRSGGGACLLYGMDCCVCVVFGVFTV